MEFGRDGAIGQAKGIVARYYTTGIRVVERRCKQNTLKKNPAGNRPFGENPKQKGGKK